MGLQQKHFSTAAKTPAADTLGTQIAPVPLSDPTRCGPLGRGPNPIDLRRKLARVIVLTGGPRSRRASGRHGPVWDRAAEMILIAATTGKAAESQEATRQI